MRRSGFRAGHALAALVLALITVLTLQPASASKLTLTSPSRSFATSMSRCSGSQLTITINAQAVSVTGLDASKCAGATLRVFAHTASGTVTGSTTVSGSTADFTLPAPVSAADGVAASLDTWLVPVTWTVVPPTLPLLTCESLDDPNLTCAATVDLTSWGTSPNRVFKLFVTVTTTSTTPVRWGVTLNLSSTQLPFTPKGVQDVQGGLRVSAFSGCSSNPKTLKLYQDKTWGNSSITVGSAATFEVQGYETGPGNLVSCP